MDRPDDEGIVVSVAADHPGLPGHFPGRPIVPAVVILDEVRAALGRRVPTPVIGAIEHAKFLDAVLPERPFRIALSFSGEAAVDFACIDMEDGRRLATGRLVLVRPEDE